MDKKRQEKPIKYECRECKKTLAEIVNENKNLIRANGVDEFECSDCLTQEVEDLTASIHKIIHPGKILKILNDKIVGQQDLKETLSIAISNHVNNSIKGVKNSSKGNVMIIGPSGSGKTEAVRVLSEQLQIPLLIVDATEFTASGYVGRSVTEIASDYFRLCKGDKDQMERGVIFIDEIDKKAVRGPNSGEVATAMVQDSLLKFVEGHIVNVDYKDERGIKRVGKVDTSKILFISAGAFDGIKIKSETKRVSLGGNKNSTEVPADEIRQAMRDFGMKLELLRRFPLITRTSKLNENEVFTILKSKNSPIKDLEENLKHINISFKLKDELCLYLAKKSQGAEVPLSYIANMVLKFHKKLAFYGGDIEEINALNFFEQE